MTSAIPTLITPAQVVKASPHALGMAYGGSNDLEFDQYLWVIGYALGNPSQTGPG